MIRNEHTSSYNHHWHLCSICPTFFFQIHSLTCGLKAFSTDQMMWSVEICRLSCGGHGFSQASGLPKIYDVHVPACTYEGENTVLYLQCGRWTPAHMASSYTTTTITSFTSNDTGKLPSFQNCFARVVTRSSSFSCSVPSLKSLHWLPVHYRIILEICTKAYQALSSTQPAYLN